MLATHGGHNLKLSNFATNVLDRYGFTAGRKWIIFVAQVGLLLLGVLFKIAGLFQLCSICMITAFLLLTLECRLASNLYGKKWVTNILNVMIVMWIIGYAFLIALMIFPDKWAIWLTIHASFWYGKILCIVEFLLAFLCVFMAWATRTVLSDYKYRKDKYENGKATAYNGWFKNKTYGKWVTKWASRFVGHKLGAKIGNHYGNHKQRFLLRRMMLDDKKVRFLLKKEGVDFEV